MDNMSEIIAEPIEESNANIIKVACNPATKLLMLRYEELYNFYSEEPMHINIKIDENQHKILTFEQILRLRYWISNEKACSWIIYSDEREFDSFQQNNSNGLVVRNVCWNKKYDEHRVRDEKRDKTMLLKSWPRITANNWFVSNDKIKEIVDAVQSLDEHIKYGFNLKNKSTEDNKEWKDTELLRLFDWGQIHSTWCSAKTNIEIEKRIHKLEEELKILTSNIDNSISAMELDFSCHPKTKMQLVNYGL